MLILRLVGGKWKSRLKTQPLQAMLYELLAILFLISILHSVLYKYLENSNWNEAWWQTFQGITTIGYGNSPPESFWGRLNAALLITPGLALLGNIISVVFEIKADKAEKKRLGMLPNPYTDSFIVVNFPGVNELDALFRQWRNQDPDIGIFIIDEVIEELPPFLLAKYDNMSFGRGNILRDDIFEQAKVSENRHVVIYPKDPHSESSDVITKGIVDKIKRKCGDSVKIIFVLVDEDSEEMFQNVLATDIPQSLESLAIASETSDEYVADAITRLLKNTEGAFLQTVSMDKFEGWLWEDFEKAFISVKYNHRLLLDIHTLVQDGKVQYLPTYDTRIGGRDLLHIVVFKRLDWGDLSDRIVKVAQVGSSKTGSS
jgi:hypothetical protein